MHTLVGESIGAFIVVGHEHPLEAYYTGSFPYENFFRFGEAWRVSYFLIFMIRGWQANIYLIPSASSFNPVNSWRRQPLGNVTSWEPFEASYGQWRRDGSLADAEFPSACIVAVTIHGHRSIYFYPHIIK